MMGQHLSTELLFCYFRLEEQISEDHLLRLIDRYADFCFVAGVCSVERGFQSPSPDRCLKHSDTAPSESCLARRFSFAKRTWRTMNPGADRLSRSRSCHKNVIPMAEKHCKSETKSEKGRRK